MSDTIVQAQRDSRRKSSTPSRTNQVQAPYSRTVLPGTKRSRQFTTEDLNLTVIAVCDSSKASKPQRQRL